MPHELESIDDIDDKLLARTFEVYRKGIGGDMIKYKLRTKKTLFTIKIESASASKIESKIEASTHPIEIIDV